MKNYEENCKGGSSPDLGWRPLSDLPKAPSQNPGAFVGICRRQSGGRGNGRGRSEGIFDQDKIPGVDYIKGMCKYLENVGELYFIQVFENGEYSSVGDVTVKAENPPIAIWQEKYRGVGIGSKVMKAVIDRLSFLGYKRITGSSVFKWNTSSQRMHERLGFARVGETENDFIYEYVIKEK